MRNFDPSDLSRREFLGRSALALAATALAACSDPTGPDETPGRLPDAGSPLRVAIVGAGVSGLVAGYELRRAGHDVQVFEARPRVGGRVLTLREPFAPGHLAEAGAARIRPEHDLTLGYARHFGLELVRFYPDTGTYLRVADGRRTELSADTFTASRSDYVKIRGGTDRLPGAFASALGGRVETGAAVARIEQHEAGVRVHGVDGWIHEADRVLCAVPLTVLDRIQFSPALSEPKMRAARGGFDYRAATRVFVRFPTRFWRDGGHNGWAVTDWPEELWHPTWDRPGPEGVLLSYVRGERALALDALSDGARVGAVVAHWEEVFPGVSDHAAGGVSHAWAEEPWSRGAWASPTAAQDAELRAHVARQEGRIHFAGEHDSEWRGWMQGALSSGLRAARELHRAPAA